MEDLVYLNTIDRKQHIITAKDIFAYYDVTKLKGDGNLRMIYGRKDKRDLVISIFNVYIAEMFDVFVEGGIVFNFPDQKTSKMAFYEVPRDIIRKSRQAGKLQMLDPVASGFTGIKTLIKLPSNKAIFDVNVVLSKNYQETIYKKLNTRQNLIGKKDKIWSDFMQPVYNTFAKCDKKSLDHLVLFGLRKMIFFLTKRLEILLMNNKGDHVYIGRFTNKIKDLNKRYKLLEQQYVKKLRWHANSKKFRSEYSYYCLSKEFYAMHLGGQTVPKVLMKKLKEECLVRSPSLKYVFRTKSKSNKFANFVQNYDSSNDELIFIKPDYAQKHN